VDWLDPAEAIARRALSILPRSDSGEPAPRGPDVARFTSGRTDLVSRRLLQGFGLKA